MAPCLESPQMAGKSRFVGKRHDPKFFLVEHYLDHIVLYIWMLVNSLYAPSVREIPPFDY